MTVICSRCDEPIEDDIIKCYGPCRGKFHIQCTTMTLRTHRAKSEAKKMEWKCLTCRNKASKTEISACSSEEPTENENEEQKKSPPKKGITRIEEKIDLLLTENMKLNKHVEDLMTIVAELRSNLTVKDTELKQLKDDLQEFQQHSRSNYLEIHNVPNYQNENQNLLEDIATSVVKEVGIQLTKNEIEAIHRIPTKNRNKPSPIILELSSRKKRNQIIKAKKGKSISQNIVKDGREAEKIYLNESLTKFYKHLLYQAKEEARKLNYKFVWTSDGKILIRKDENSPIRRIRNEDDLTKL